MYRSGDKFLQHVVRHVAATNRLVCTVQSFWKSLSQHQNAVAAISRTNSVWFDFVRLVAVTSFCCGDQIFHKKRYVAATSGRNVLLQLVVRIHQWLCAPFILSFLSVAPFYGSCHFFVRTHVNLMNINKIVAFKRIKPDNKCFVATTQTKTVGGNVMFGLKDIAVLTS